MKKEELKNGDIVAIRSGDLGVVIKNGSENYILYQDCGMEDLDIYFNDDLTNTEGESGDIMDVYRCEHSFYEIDLNDPAPDWSRDLDWQRPVTRERETREAIWEEQRLQYIEKMREEEEEIRQRKEEIKKTRISIVTQWFYGNRTWTEISRDDVKYFIRGHMAPSLYNLFDVSDVVLKTIPVPGDENIVIVYDQTEEDEYVNIEFPRWAEELRKEYGEELHMKATCTIPELGVELHTRCFACRVDENGVFQSLEDGDEDKFFDYFPIK